MLADELDYVVGVDPHQDTHAFAIVEVRTGGVAFEASVGADPVGYAAALRAVQEHAPGRRAFAIEGVGSFGAGFARFLVERGECVFEVGRIRREHRSSGKTDALDAVRAARSVLTRKRPAIPRSSGEREALRALVAAREGAVIAKQAGLSQLRHLLVTAPEPLRSELRPLTRARLLKHLAATHPQRRNDPELRGTALALRAIARRVLTMTREERELTREIDKLTRKLAPQLLDQASVRFSPRK
jgi:transposase